MAGKAINFGEAFCMFALAWILEFTKTPRIPILEQYSRSITILKQHKKLYKTTSDYKGELSEK